MRLPSTVICGMFLFPKSRPNRIAGREGIHYPQRDSGLPTLSGRWRFGLRDRSHTFLRRTHWRWQVHRPSRVWIHFAVGAILILGMALRVRDVTSCLNGDEGESCLNALTILQSGVG